MKIIIIFLYLSVIAFEYNLSANENTIEELTAENYESKIIEPDKIIVLDFYIESCAACVKETSEISYILDNHDKYKGILNNVNFYKVNGQQVEALSSFYDIWVYPTLVIFSSNNPDKSIQNEGFITSDIILKIISEFNKI